MPCSRISILLYCPQQTTFASDTCSSYCCHPTLSFTAYLTASNKVSLSNAPQLAAALYWYFHKLIYIYLVVFTPYVSSLDPFLEPYQRTTPSVFWDEKLYNTGKLPSATLLSILLPPTRQPSIRLFFHLLLGFQSLSFLTTTVAFVDLCILLGVQSPHSLLPSGVLGLYHKNSLWYNKPFTGSPTNDSLAQAGLKTRTSQGKTKYQKNIRKKILLWLFFWGEKNKRPKTVSAQTAEHGFTYIHLDLITSSPPPPRLSLLALSVSECFMNTSGFILTVVACYQYRDGQ